MDNARGVVCKHDLKLIFEIDLYQGLKWLNSQWNSSFVLVNTDYKLIKIILVLYNTYKRLSQSVWSALLIWTAAKMCQGNT